MPETAFPSTSLQWRLLEKKKKKNLHQPQCLVFRHSRSAHTVAWSGGEEAQWEDCKETKRSLKKNSVDLVTQSQAKVLGVGGKSSSGGGGWFTKNPKCALLLSP